MKTTKSFGSRVSGIVDRLYKLQESIQEALDEYEYYDEEEHNGKPLSEKQQEAWDELQGEYDEVQNAIDYLEMFTSDNL